MASYTLSEATEFYEEAKTAYKNALTNKRYGVSGREKENQALTSLKKEMLYWKGQIDIINGKGGINVKKVIPYA